VGTHLPGARKTRKVSQAGTVREPNSKRKLRSNELGDAEETSTKSLPAAGFQNPPRVTTRRGVPYICLGEISKGH